MRYFLCLFVTLCSLLSAEETKPEIIVLPQGHVHEGDYFAAGKSVEISGTVKGDLYVLATQLFIDGVVEGDIIAGGGSLEISGEVKGDVRAIGGQVMLTGAVGGSMTLISGNITLTSAASIQGNLVSVAGNIDMAAPISGNVTALASNVRISSHILGNLKAYVAALRLTSRADLAGNLFYRSSQEAIIDPQAHIGGTIEHQPSFVSELIEGSWVEGLLVGSKVAAILMNFIYSLVIGLILLKVFPKVLHDGVHALERTPLKSLAWGLLVLILLPLTCLLLLMTILGAPFALTLIAFNVIGFYTAKLFTIVWGSNILFSKMGLKPNRFPILFLGLLLYFLLVQIPYVGNIIAFAGLIAGLGAATLSQIPHHPHRASP